mmetsp:Transcript_24980/g.87052  ORF Transcript_24980/g.87052 Transcript_24980/m.87052 type:complete len:265 (+) Transcript_24980:299-1093(+)
MLVKPLPELVVRLSDQQAVHLLLDGCERLLGAVEHVRDVGATQRVLVRQPRLNSKVVVEKHHLRGDEGKRAPRHALVTRRPRCARRVDSCDGCTFDVGVQAAQYQLKGRAAQRLHAVAVRGARDGRAACLALALLAAFAGTAALAERGGRSLPVFPHALPPPQPLPFVLLRQEPQEERACDAMRAGHCVRHVAVNDLSGDDAARHAACRGRHPTGLGNVVILGRHQLADRHQLRHHCVGGTLCARARRVRCKPRGMLIRDEAVG